MWTTQTYSVGTYSVNSLIGEYLCNHCIGRIDVEFLLLGLDPLGELLVTFLFDYNVDADITGEKCMKIGCIVSEKSAWKSVHRISAYTVLCS